MPALALDPDTLPAPERAELLALLDAPPILAEPETRSLALGWVLLALLGAGVLGALLFGFGPGLGVIIAPWQSRGLWIALPYSFATMTLAIGLFKSALAFGQGRLPWKMGRFLVAQGFLDTRRRPLRFRPIADFTRVEIAERKGENTPASFFTITVHFGDESEVFHLFCMPRIVPRAALEELGLHRDAALDAQRSEGGYRFARRAELKAPAPAPKRPRLAEHPVQAAALAGLLAVLPLLFGLLPLLSIRAAERQDRVASLRAAAAAYPYGWVKDRARSAIHARFEIARARVSTGVVPDRRPAFMRLLTSLEQPERSRVYLRLVTPDEAQTRAATQALEERVQGLPGATAAPIVLYYQSVSLAGVRVGEEQLIRGLSSSLGTVLPPDVMELEREPSRLDAAPPDPEVPVLEIRATIKPTSLFRGENGRVYAALTFDFETALLLPGEAKIPLVPAITVDPPSDLSVSRFVFGREKLPPLGGAGDKLLDRADDALVYTKQAEIAADTAAMRISKALLLP